ncbi:putative PPE family protein PPE29 [Mycobacterium basiliense]|uniref:Putative PPE family protein PPE29 n=1 Tax=Mycobacterium basiliense TaxID=2094119 RepID=A0A447GEH6_9MYCO|nr:PPE family protein [Mycobacterium basiliense]VDM88779.1 putative PPE family protein PPE29 [Mycobacterium basiliense]
MGAAVIALSDSVPTPPSDYGALPPEINSGRMYCGPGSASLLAAAGAWDSLAAELYSTAAGYGLVISELPTMCWFGPAADAMVAAALPFVGWLSTTATLAEQAGMQARAAAAAYEMAFAMTVPPSVIASNRALLLALVATNWFGQNSAAIAATEAQYAEMWAQDAAAMYEYAGSAAAASTLTPFTTPPHTTAPGGIARQAAAAASKPATVLSEAAARLASSYSLASQLGQQFALGASGDAQKYWIEILSALATTEGFIYDGGGLTLNALQVVGAMLFAPAVAAADAVAGPAGAAALSALAPLGAGPPVVASAGLASAIGPMSVPPAWSAQAAVSQARTVALSLPQTNAETAGLSGLLQGMPMRAQGQHGRNFGRRYGVRHRVVCRPPSAG